jgi:hypothetical protein
MKRIIDVETGEVFERELNEEELAQQEIDSVEVIAERNARKADEKAKAKAKEAAENKLAALGLTVEDLTALGL